MELQCHSETLSNYDPPPLLRRARSVNEDKRRRPLKAICAPTNSSTQMNGEISTSGWQPGRHLGNILSFGEIRIIILFCFFGEEGVFEVIGEGGL